MKPDPVPVRRQVTTLFICQRKPIPIIPDQTTTEKMYFK